MPKKALAKFDDANIIARRIKQLGITNNLFGRYAGHSSPSICSLLNGAKRLTKDEAEKLQAVAADLELVARAAFPIRVDFSDVENTRAVVEQLKNGSLMIGKVRGGVLEFHGSDNIQFGGDF